MAGRRFLRRQARRDMSAFELNQIMSNLERLQNHFLTGNVSEAHRLYTSVKQVRYSPATTTAATAAATAVAITAAATTCARRWAQ